MEDYSKFLSGITKSIGNVFFNQTATRGVQVELEEENIEKDLKERFLNAIARDFYLLKADVQNYFSQQELALLLKRGLLQHNERDGKYKMPDKVMQQSFHRGEPIIVLSLMPKYVLEMVSGYRGIQRDAIIKGIIQEGLKGSNWFIDIPSEHKNGTLQDLMPFSLSPEAQEYSADKLCEMIGISGYNQRRELGINDSSSAVEYLQKKFNNYIEKGAIFFWKGDSWSSIKVVVAPSIFRAQDEIDKQACKDTLHKIKNESTLAPKDSLTLHRLHPHEYYQYALMLYGQFASGAIGLTSAGKLLSRDMQALAKKYVSKELVEYECNIIDEAVDFMQKQFGDSLYRMETKLKTSKPFPESVLNLFKVADNALSEDLYYGYKKLPDDFSWNKWILLKDIKSYYTARFKNRDGARLSESDLTYVFDNLCLNLYSLYGRADLGFEIDSEKKNSKAALTMVRLVSPKEKVIDAGKLKSTFQDLMLLPNFEVPVSVGVNPKDLFQAARLLSIKNRSTLVLDDAAIKRVQFLQCSKKDYITLLEQVFKTIPDSVRRFVEDRLTDEEPLKVCFGMSVMIVRNPEQLKIIRKEFEKHIAEVIDDKVLVLKSGYRGNVVKMLKSRGIVWDEIVEEEEEELP